MQPMIIPKAINANLADNIPVEETIRNCKDINEFITYIYRYSYPNCTFYILVFNNLLCKKLRLRQQEFENIFSIYFKFQKNRFEFPL